MPRELFPRGDMSAATDMKAEGCIPYDGNLKAQKPSTSKLHQSRGQLFQTGRRGQLSETGTIFVSNLELLPQV